MHERPTGTVTFLFSDIVGSTRAWEDHPDEMRAALERHDAIVRTAIVGHGGYVFSTSGDAFAAAFDRAGDAVDAAGTAQEKLSGEPWPEPVMLSVRMGVHTGEAQERDGDYFGAVLNRAARIMQAAHGGQTLVTAATAELSDREPLVDLGEHRLKDLSQPLRLFQLGDAVFPPIMTLALESHRLPVQRTELLGRDDDIATVAELLAEHRLVTLTGFGGIGKTRLALATAAEVSDRYRGGVHFVDLAPLTDGSLVGLAALGATGVRAQPVDGTMHDRAATALAGQDALLILDNCEHVLDDVAEFADRLLALPDGPAVLATSREALELDGERRFKVHPLGIADDDAGVSPAVELFLLRAAAVEGHLEATDPTVRRLCRRLDGVPLAIELAAARTSLMSAADLLARLDDQLSVLTTHRRRGRHHSLEAVLQWSWDLLDDKVADLLIELGVFSGSWTLEAAEAVCDDGSTVLERLDTLVSCSLVEVVDGPLGTRYRMLEPVRQFVEARLDSDERRKRLRDRHVDWWVAHATGRPVGEQWFSARWALEIEEELDNLRAALDHALEAGRPEDAATIIGAINAFLIDAFRGCDLELWTGAALEQCADPPARLWMASAINHFGLEDFTEGAKRSGIALRVALASGDDACASWAADVASVGLAPLDPTKSTEMAEIALRAAHGAGDDTMLGMALVWTGTAAFLLGDHVTALERFDDAARLLPEEWSLGASERFRILAVMALDVPEAGDPDALLDAAAAAAPTAGLHTRYARLCRAYLRALEGDVAAVRRTMYDALDVYETHRLQEVYIIPAIAAVEVLEFHGRTEEAATIIAALDGQPFGLVEIESRYRRACERLPSMPVPGRKLAVPELHEIVLAQLATVADASLEPS